MDAGLSTAGDHHVSVAVCDETGRITNGVRTCCASCCGRVVWALETVFHGNVPSCKIYEYLRHKQWRYLLVALLKRSV